MVGGGAATGPVHPYGSFSGFIASPDGFERIQKERNAWVGSIRIAKRPTIYRGSGNHSCILHFLPAHIVSRLLRR